MLIESKKLEAAEVARAASQMRTVLYRSGSPLDVYQLLSRDVCDVSPLVQHTKLCEVRETIYAKWSLCLHFSSLRVFEQRIFVKVAVSNNLFDSLFQDFAIVTFLEVALDVDRNAMLLVEYCGRQFCVSFDTLVDTHIKTTQHDCDEPREIRKVRKKLVNMFTRQYLSHQ